MTDAIPHGRRGAHGNKILEGKEHSPQSSIRTIRPVPESLSQLPAQGWCPWGSVSGSSLLVHAPQ